MAFVETSPPASYRHQPRDPACVGLSIIVPTWNGGHRLTTTLRHLQEFRDGLPERTELVIVDDCSAPSTARIVDNFADNNPLTIVLRNERNRGKGYAVARGMLHATGDHRVFVDSDLAYPSCQITKLLDALKDGADLAIACRVLPESRYVMSPTFFRYLYTRHLMSCALNELSHQVLLSGILHTLA